MYEVEKREFKDSEIIGGDYPIATGVKPAKVAIKKNAPVKLTAGKLAPVETADVNSADIYGIAAEEAKANEDTVVYLTGEFKASELALETSVTAEQIEIALRKLGIFLV